MRDQDSSEASGSCDPRHGCERCARGSHLRSAEEENFPAGLEVALVIPARPDATRRSVLLIRLTFEGQRDKVVAGPVPRHVVRRRRMSSPRRIGSRRTWAPQLGGRRRLGDRTGGPHGVGPAPPVGLPDDAFELVEPTVGAGVSSADHVAAHLAVSAREAGLGGAPLGSPVVAALPSWALLGGTVAGPGVTG